MPRRFTARSVAAIVLLAVGSVAGCGGGDGRLPTHPAAGKVTLDGQPVPAAEVWLVPKTDAVATAAVTIRPYAKTDADGTFTLSTYLTNDGAPAGEYAVMVLTAAQAAGDTADDMPAARPAKGGKRPVGVPGRYGSPATSGLTATVNAGPNTLAFELKSK